MSATTNGKSVSIGVIGCGTIASAIVTGLARAQEEHEPKHTSHNNPDNALTHTMPEISKISLSLRSQAKSSALKEKFPKLVTVYENNQDILDQSDIVFLCVLNDQTATVLEPLTFDETRHTLVSLVVRTVLVQDPND